MARNMELLMKRIACTAHNRNDVLIFPLPCCDDFRDQVNLCGICVKTGYETYQRYIKWATCRILGPSGGIKEVENLKNYQKLKTNVMTSNGGQKTLEGSKDGVKWVARKGRSK